MSNIKRICPHCQSMNLSVFNYSQTMSSTMQTASVFRIRCGSCGLEGPTKATYKEAMESWDVSENTAEEEKAETQVVDPMIQIILENQVTMMIALVAMMEEADPQKVSPYYHWALSALREIVLMHIGDPDNDNKN